LGDPAAAQRGRGDESVRELTEFAIPIQERHFTAVRETALAMAGEEDPLEAG
jgi:hypothetical protein